MNYHYYYYYYYLPVLIKVFEYDYYGRMTVFYVRNTRSTFYFGINKNNYTRYATARYTKVKP